MRRAWTHAAGVLTALAVLTPSAGAATYSAAGADPSSIQPTVAAFQADLGTPSRDVTWDDVPDNLADPNYLPWDGVTSQGIWFSDPGFRQFLVSATAASGRAPEFGAYDAGFPAELQPYSGERLFTRADLNTFDLNFVVPGSHRAAATRGFGIVFADVDNPNLAEVRLIGLDGSLLDTLTAQPLDKGLSFVGATYPTASIARVTVHQGGLVTGRRGEDQGGDVVAMDDFLYGEPQPAPGYVQFKADAFRVAEGPSLFTDHATRTGNLQFGASLSFEPIGGTATPGVDYEVSPSSAYLPAGDAGRNIGAIYPVHDTVHEGDETAVVRIVPDSYTDTGAPSVATFTIVDDDPAAPALARDLTAPRLSGVFAASGRRPALTFRLDEPATVTVHLARLLPGRRVGRRCLTPTRVLRRRPPCVRIAQVPGSLTRVGRVGANRIVIPSRVGGRRLVPGRYSALLSVADAARNARARALRFTLTR
jgi:hypothetical protein